MIALGMAVLLVGYALVYHGVMALKSRGSGVLWNVGILDVLKPGFADTAIQRELEHAAPGSYYDDHRRLAANTAPGPPAANAGVPAITRGPVSA